MSKKCPVCGSAKWLEVETLDGPSYPIQVVCRNPNREARGGGDGCGWWAPLSRSQVVQVAVLNRPTMQRRRAPPLRIAKN